MAAGYLARAKLLEQEELMLVKLRETLAGQLRRLQVEELAIRSMMRNEEMAAEEQEAAAARGGSSSSGSRQQHRDRGSTKSARASAAAVAPEAAKDEINAQPLALSLDFDYGKLWGEAEQAEAEDDVEDEDDDEEEEN